MSERKNRRLHFPLTIDTLGGVLMTTGEGKKREINFKLGKAGSDLRREVSGADWRVSSGEGKGKVDIQAFEDAVNVSCLKPFMVLEYSRGLGALRDIMVSGVDLALLASEKMALALGDKGNSEDLRQCGEDRIFCLRFTPDGLQLIKIDASGKEIVETVVEDDGNLGANDYGFIPNSAQYSWRGNLGFLRGKVGFEVFSDKVLLFYEKRAKDGLVRQNVMEVPRTVLGVSKLDWKVTQGVPSDEDLLEFMEEVYLPML